MRQLTGAHCKKCDAGLQTVTDKGGLWGFATCENCQTFNDVTDMMQHGGRVYGEAD